MNALVIGGALDLIALWWAKWNVLGAKLSLRAFDLFLPAAAGPETQEPWGPMAWGMPQFVWHILNFLILVGIIFFAARKGVVATQRKKRETIAASIAEATKLRDEMRAKFEDYDARMRDIDARMTALLEDSRKEAEADRARTVESATALANRIREDAKLIADQEIARAKRELQEEQILQAAELAEQLLKQNVNADDQSRLTQEFLGKIEPKIEAKGNGRPM